jgi:hypothetical protein
MMPPKFRILRKTLLLTYASLLALVLSAVGCGGSLKLAELNENPGQYNEQTVTVKGRVVQTFGLPVLQQSIAKIDDGTGAVWVKPRGRVPYEGEKIEIKGTVKVGMTFANRDFAVVVLENVAP